MGSNITQDRPVRMQASIKLPEPPHIDKTALPKQWSSKSKNTRSTPRSNDPSVGLLWLFIRIEALLCAHCLITPFLAGLHAKKIKACLVRESAFEPLKKLKSCRKPNMKFGNCFASGSPTVIVSTLGQNAVWPVGAVSKDVK